MLAFVYNLHIFTSAQMILLSITYTLSCLYHSIIATVICHFSLCFLYFTIAIYVVTVSIFNLLIIVCSFSVFPTFILHFTM